MWWRAGGGTIGGDFIAPFKTTHIDTDGSLRLVYWKGNNALKGAERKKKKNALCKKTPFARHFVVNSGHFTKTGSGQTQEKTQKERRFLAVAGSLGSLSKSSAVGGLNGTLGFVVEVRQRSH
eukprot:COSAG06_NODE_12639_length_1349_cov_2.499200_3_plen_121_part_01